MTHSIPEKCHGWWRITDTETWATKFLDTLGPALLSLTGDDDKLRMHRLLAYVTAKPTSTGVSFKWDGAWEYDQVSGTGNVKVGKDGRMTGKIKIKDGDESSFTAERTSEPNQFIPHPPSYRDKWRQR